MKNIKRNIKDNPSNDNPLYNIRILRSYIDYVKSNYPNIDIDKVLEYSGVSKLQYNDYGYWCNQHQMNRLQEILIKETNNINISRDTGRSLMASQNSIALYIFGFANPVNVIRQIGKIYNKLSRAAIIEINSLKNNKYEFITKPATGVKEELYQCKNRIGSLEGLLKLFLYEYPQIEHPECLHEGAEYCRYIITLDGTSNIFKWIRIRNHTILSGICFTVLFYVLFPVSYAILTAFLSLTFVTCLTQYAFRLEKNKMHNDFIELSRIAEFYLNELNIRYNVTKLVQEVGEITSVVQNQEEISSAVAKVMNKRLDYDRGAILLAKNDQSSLYFAGGYGFSENEIELLSNVEFRLDTTATEGVLQKVFNRQEPQLVEDMGKIAHMLDTKNRALVKKLQVQAMVCVPIIHEDESLGVMAVDSLEPYREFREGDINLLMAIASQTGLSIAHAKAFQKLHESEKKHRVLVETIRDIVYTVDMEGRFTYISPMVEGITGFKDKELVGRNFLEIVAPSYRETALRRFEKVLKSNETSRYEIEIAVKDGRSVPLEINTAPLSDNIGNTIGRIGVARDITERVLEQKKRKEMEIKALTQDKLASLGEIATGIAHEINQPLSYIKIILESTIKDIEAAKVDRRELAEEFNESLRQIGKISSIISHLRTFGRSDVISFGPVKLSRVLDDTLILMHKRLRIKNINFDRDIADNLPMLHGNHIKLEQVFINLIQNSLDAMEEQKKGAIILKARVDNDGTARITYTDTGKGIASKYQQKIFDPFFSTKEPGKGTGIGLAIVYGIIQEHNGEITCASDEGMGASFEIKLPLYVE